MSCINGHFWIADEKTGEVIYDPEFKHIDFLLEVHNAVKSTRFYEPCSMERQREAIRDHVAKPFAVILKNKDSAPHNFWEPRFLQCAINVAKYKAQGNKGKIVYGNIGYKRKTGDIWYHYNDSMDEDEAHEDSKPDWERWEASLTKKEKKQKRHYYNKHTEKLNKALMETQFQFIRWGHML